MNITPTESEFDKELGGILSGYASYTHVPKVFKTSAEMDKSEAIAAIKQAVDKHVIGMDALALAISPPIRVAELGREWTSQHDEYKKASIESAMQRRQRKALYGGDKK